MSNLFDGDSDTEINFKCNNEYAKNYNHWRKKEVLNKLQSKYGESFGDDNSDNSSSSEDDEEGVEITEQLEKDFFTTLASLKKKDPKIYDDNFKFFNNATALDPMGKKRKNKEKPMYIMDYERKLILEKGGELSDDNDEEENTRARSPTYVEEQQKLKESIKTALNNTNDGDDEEEENEWGGMFKTRQKSKEEKEKEEADYKQWLLGQKQKLDDQTVEKDLKPLKDYWSDPKLDEGEKFLRDYILNKKFLDNEDENYVPTYEEVVHDSDENLSEDERAVEKQEEFEHKFNYRFEEPDQEYLKRYPRTMENSLRKTDDRRKVKRQELKERKVKEKQQKMEEIKQLKELKKQEIEEKIKKLREITGNTEVAFEDQDLDDDFDPEAHDRRMKALFDDGFYQGEEDDQKPEFPDLDEELEIERWDKYNPDENSQDNPESEVTEEVHCEDDDFTMDCEYDPQATQKELIENSKGKRKRKRKSKFAAALSEPKPAFDPNDKSYEEYLDEYYKLDCEDIIGDIPCRFKYRKVVPNSFGLTIDEILRANDRELNRWCSLKKAIQHRPDHIEKYDQIAFAKKAQNEALKRKILPSLYADETTNNASTSGATTPVNKKNKGVTDDNVDGNQETAENETSELNKDTIKNNRKRKRKTNDDHKRNKKSIDDIQETAESKTSELNKNNKKRKRKTNDGKKNKKDGSAESSKITADVNNKNVELKKKKIKKLATEIIRKKKDKFNKKKQDNPNELSDARLQAFGIKPKKFKNKIKYTNRH